MGLTVAIVGLNFGELWVPIYQLHPDVDRIVLCDPMAETLKRVGDETGVADRYDTLEAVLADPTIDAVHLLTPLHLHAEQTMAVMGAGKHCAVAVTPSLDVADLQVIVDLQKSSGRSYMMMETGAFSDPVVHIRQLISSGEFGDVAFARGEHHQDMEGWPGYWVGLPPMWYSTHALAPLLSVLDARVATVRALGSGRLPESSAAVWGNPYPLEIALYELEDSPVAIEVTRSMFKTARAPIESFAVYGDNHGLEWGRTFDEAPLFYSVDGLNPNGRGRLVTSETYRVPDLSATLPPELADANQMYWGAAPRLVHEFVRSIVEERLPALDAVVAANWTAAGFAAHESAMNGGTVVPVPSFTTGGSRSSR